MKITLVCHDIPYPANRGARIDIWRRMKAFVSIGVELQLITWYSEPPTSEQINEMKKYCQDTHFIPFKYNKIFLARRVIDLFAYPLEVTSRILRGKELNTVLTAVSTFRPDVIWLDGIHGGEIANTLSQKLGIPLVTRSHNVEHLYYQRLLASTIDIKSRLRRYLSVSHLEKYEKNLLKRSAFFYDISADDFKFWQSQGFDNVRYLPPFLEVPDQNSIEPTEVTTPEYDVVFLGALFVDNNIAGVIWFINQVVPIIRSTIPGVKVLIAGLNPVDKIQQICEQEGIYLSINPPSSLAIYNSGRVLINPVLTGSGVSIKSIEMLLLDKPIVSTPQGIAGIPQEVKQFFKIAEDAQSFAEEIINLLTTSVKVRIDRELLKSLFGYQVIKDIVEEIKSLQ
jgi:hypothetical protein